MNDLERKAKNAEKSKRWRDRHPEHKAIAAARERARYRRPDVWEKVRSYQRQKLSLLTPEEKKETAEKNKAWKLRRGKCTRTIEQKESQAAYKREQYRNWSAERKKQHADAHRRWWQANPEKVAVKRHRRRSKIVGVGGDFTVQEWQELVDKFGHRCLKCGKFDTEVMLTADHVVPLIKGGSNFISNIQPLCRSCNSGKRDRVIDYRQGVNVG